MKLFLIGSSDNWDGDFILAEDRKAAVAMMSWYWGIEEALEKGLEEIDIPGAYSLVSDVDHNHSIERVAKKIEPYSSYKTYRAYTAVRTSDHCAVCGVEVRASKRSPVVCTKETCYDDFQKEFIVEFLGRNPDRKVYVPQQEIVEGELETSPT